MQTISSSLPSPHNTQLYLAFQDAKGTMPPALDNGAPRWWALGWDDADFGKTVSFVRPSDMSKGRESAKPVKDRIDAPVRLTVPVDKRVFGVFLGGLFGPPVTTTAKASGFVVFERLPVADETLTLDGTDWTFGPGNDTAIGATISATVTQLATDLNASSTPAIAGATYRAEGHRLIIEAVASGAAGDTFTVAVTAGLGYASAATLRGGGLYRHVFDSSKTALPMATLYSDQADLSAGRRKAMRDLRFATMEMSFTDTGEATATVTMQGRTEIVLDVDPTGGQTVDAVVERYSHLQGGIMLDDACVCGVIESGRLSFDNGLIEQRGPGCPGNPSAGARTDSMPGKIETGVTLNARYYDPALTGVADAGDTLKILHQFYDAGDGSSLSITFAEVTVPVTQRNYGAGRFIVQNFSGMPSKPVAGAEMVVELVNDIEAY